MQNEGNSELLMVNFDLRSKAYIHRIANESSLAGSEVPIKVEDPLFQDLFN